MKRIKKRVEWRCLKEDQDVDEDGKSEYEEVSEFDSDEEVSE